jgi:hypothetical protein
MLPELLAAFALTIGPELPSSTPITEPGHLVSQPIVASDGRDFLLKWLDARGGPRIAKVASDGSITPPNGRPFGRYYGTLAWNGSNYVFVELGGPNEVEITRIDREGNVLDVVPRVGATLPNYPFLSMVSGQRMLMISAEPVFGKQQAHVLDAEGQLIRNVSLPGHVLAIGSNGKEFLILYRDDQYTLLVMRLSLDGILLAAPIAIGDTVAYGAGEFLIVSDGDGYLLVRGDLDAGAPNAAHMMTLSAGGVPRGGVTTLTLPYGLSIGCSVGWTGSAYVFAIIGSSLPESPGHQGSIWRATVGRDGSVLAPPSEVVQEGMRSIMLASNGSGALQVWGATTLPQECCTPRTYGVSSAQIVDAAGSPRGAPFPVTRSAPPQRHQEVAWSGREFLAVWSEVSGLFMGVLAADGSPLSGRGVQIVSNNVDPLYFAVAFDGRAFIVTWNEGITFFALRVRPDGTVDGTPAILGRTTRGSPINPVLACDGRGGCFVAWSDLGMRGTLLRDGVPVTPAQRLGDPAFLADPSVAFNGHHYVVAFSTPIYPPPPCGRYCFNPIGNHVTMLRVSAAGMPIDPVPVKLTLGTREPASDAYPQITWGDGETGLLVWQNGSISGVAIDRDLHLTSAIHTVDSTVSTLLRVVFDGEAYLVSSFVRLTVVSPAAVPGQSTAVFLNGEPGNLCAAGAGRGLISYVRPATGPPELDGISRAYFRIVTDLGDLPIRPRAVRH